MAKSDPKKDPKFQKVVRSFLETPPKPHSDVIIKKARKKPSSKKCS